jgi:hypothetical protein
MNQAARSIVTVLAGLVLGGGVVWADAGGDYEKQFGAEAKKVLASKSTADDAAFAKKLLKTAKMIPQLPDLQMLLYEKASQFGSAGPEGSDIAKEALALLKKAVAVRDAAALLKKRAADRKIKAMQEDLIGAARRFDNSIGARRAAAGKTYLDRLEELADIRIAQCDAVAARVLCDKAVKVATQIQSPRSRVIRAKSKRADAMAAQDAKRKSLHAALKKNARNKSARKELILLYLVVFDNPTEAARLVTDDIDQSLGARVRLAGRKLGGLDAAGCLTLGDWYYKELSRNVPSALRDPLLKRARDCYRRFGELHMKRGVQLARARASLARIDKQLGSAPKMGGGGSGKRPGTARKLVWKGITIWLIDDGKTIKATDTLTGKTLWICRLRRAAGGMSIEQDVITLSDGGGSFDVRTGKRLR